MSDLRGPSTSGSIGSSLATVIENLPLTYNQETKSLDRSVSLTPDVSAGQGSPGRPFSRGHHRRSSYESAQIQLNFARRMTTAKGTPAIAPMKRFDEPTASCFDSPDCSRKNSSETDSGYACSPESTKRSPERHCEFAVPEASTVPNKEPTKSVRFFGLPRNILSKAMSEKRWKVFSSNKSKVNGVVHTTGLILEERPSGLPAKSEDEAARHRQLYKDLIEQTKKKEQKAERERKQARDVQKRLEEQAAAACRVWTAQILPKWNEMKDSKRCRELWWQGIPAKVRGKVWSLVVGNDLNITNEIFEMNKNKALSVLSGDQNTANCSKEEQSLETTLSQIELDVTRTFPTLGLFQKKGPYHDHLQNIVGAYVCYRPNVGYVQSMTMLAAVLLLQMEAYPAFVAFANLLERPLQSAFFELRQPAMMEYFIAYDQYFFQELPQLHAYLDKLGVRPDMYLIEWIYAMFTKSLPLDVACRVWDVYLRDGEEFIFKTALGILRMYESRLLEMDFGDCVEFLTRIPADISDSELFRNIDPFMRNYSSAETSKNRRRFLQILIDVDKELSASSSSEELSNSVSKLKISQSLSSFIDDLLLTEP